MKQGWGFEGRQIGISKKKMTYCDVTASCFVLSLVKEIV